jgi:hypothetical protein
VIPNGRNASIIALEIADGAAIVPASPQPLTPSGFVAQGVLSKAVS